jgi:hypothetical protein
MESSGYYISGGNLGTESTQGGLDLCMEYLRVGEADVQGNNWTALVGFEHWLLVNVSTT